MLVPLESIQLESFLHTLIVQSAFLSIALLFVGALLYHESISIHKVVGVVFCLVGLLFLNR